MLPMVAMEGACLRRVMLSFMRPSPVTFTVKGLPGRGEGGHQGAPATGLAASPGPAVAQSLPGTCLSANLMLMM